MLVALGSCLVGGIASVAQHREIQLRSVKATLSGEHDILGILGADPEVPNRFTSVKVHYDIDADATAGRDRRGGRAVAEALGRLRHPHQPGRVTVEVN